MPDHLQSGNARWTNGEGRHRAQPDPPGRVLVRRSKLPLIESHEAWLARMRAQHPLAFTDPSPDNLLVAVGRIFD